MQPVNLEKEARQHCRPTLYGAVKACENKASKDYTHLELDRLSIVMYGG